VVPPGRVLPIFAPLQQPQQQPQQIIAIPVPQPAFQQIVALPQNQAVPQLTRRSPRKNIGVPPTRYPY